MIERGVGVRRWAGLPAGVSGVLLLALLFFLPSSGWAQQPGAAAGATFVDSIRVEGTVRQNAGVVAALSGLQAGTLITFREIQEATKALMATGEFEDVRILAQGREGESVVLIIQVDERDMVRRVTFEGLERVRASEVIDSAGLRGNAPFNPASVSRARSYIRDRLARNGIPFARIEESLRPVPGVEGTVDLVFQVTEGNRITVSEVDFSGNNSFPDSDLRGVLSTKPEGFLWFRTGSYDEEILREDLGGALPQFYASQGFLDMQVVGDTLIIDPETGNSRVEIMVDEGPRYRLGEFAIEGNRRFPTGPAGNSTSRKEEGGAAEEPGVRRPHEQAGAPPFDQVAFSVRPRWQVEEPLQEQTGTSTCRWIRLLGARSGGEGGPDPNS